MAQARQEFIRQAEELEARAAKEMSLLRKKMDTSRRVDVHATEERKNLHIQSLEANHEKAFADMKSYYNDITIGNVNVIKTLRDNIEELRSNLTRVQRLLDESHSEEMRKTQALSAAENEMAQLRKISKMYESEKSAHKTTQDSKSRLMAEVRGLKLNLDILQAKYSEVRPIDHQDL
ncbi:unnamed protein product [Protopolystoma xenopodis]|uniref:Dynein regulatory complex subunit 4 n=1 Tax=Protopolystoma xenopodis TaxID=117903 RepID=A0A448WGX8_9PLAT|nr:unnamed protein product [Protopolystoma xenopodis]